MGATFGRPAIDMTGQVLFSGAVTVLRRPGLIVGGRRWVIRFAECGHEQQEDGWTLRSRDKHHQNPPRCQTCLESGVVGHRANFISYTGRRIGSVDVLSRVADSESGHVTWQCRCDCGVTFTTLSQNLKNAKGSYGCAACRAHNRLTRVRAALTGKKQTARKSKWCPVCAALPHRRPAEGCPRCGEPYAAEPAQSIEAFMERREQRELS
jgi:hypothetical protein